jgi:archaemetzincin
LEPQKIALIYHGQFEQDCLDTIVSDIRQAYGFPAEIRECHSEISEFFDPSRRQYDANKLLKYMDEQMGISALKTIGLFRVDLFIPILTYIFGQAAYKGRTGVISVYRLRNEQYGLPPDQELLMQRLRKVVIHELGHTFGLVHCLNPDCVMRSSTYVEDIDQKKLQLCSQCRQTLKDSPQITQINTKES